MEKEALPGGCTRARYAPSLRVYMLRRVDVLVVDCHLLNLLNVLIIIPRPWPLRAKL